MILPRLVRVNPSILTRMPGRIVTSAPPGFDWYVDSLAGDDGNTGKSPAQAFLTIAAANAMLQTGDRIGLRRGSEWREKLDVLTGCHVGAYGSGARPKFECRDPIAAGAWTKSGGYTNVYQASIAFEAGIPEGPQVHVWEAGVPYYKRASIALVDANPGSYYIASDTVSPQTLYIHAFSSTDPTSDGKARLYTARAYGVGSDDAVDNLVIRDVHAIGPLRASGGIIVRDYSQVINCVLEWGGSHNLYMGYGGIVANCTFYDCLHSVSATHLVINANTPDGQDSYVTNCHFEQRTAFNHYGQAGPANSHNNISGRFGTVYFDGCTFKGIPGCRPIMNHFTHVVMRYCHWINGTTGLMGNTLNDSFTVIDSDWVSNVQYQRAILVNADTGACVTRFENFTITPTAVTDLAYIYASAACIVQLENVTVDTRALTTGLRTHLRLNHAGANFTWNNCTFDTSAAGANALVQLSIIPTTWSADNNRYDAANFVCYIGATPYNTLAAWKAAVAPQDANSVTF